MNIHIITSFYRKHLLETLKHYYEPMNIIWHPVCDPEDIKAFKNNKEPWIQPCICMPLSPKDHAVRKINDFFERSDIIDDDYYHFLGDDDMVEPNFYKTIRQQTANVLFVSLSRGDSIPEGAHPHPTNPLIINGPDDVKVYNIGLGQYLIKGVIASQVRFNNKNNFDDGLFAELLKTRFPNDLCFLPDLFTFGNYFEPGRYTNNDWKIKSTWELPKYV